MIAHGDRGTWCGDIMSFMEGATMNILIIGNGFDIAHGLPTKYSDFLHICSLANRITITWNNDVIEKSTNKQAKGGDKELIEKYASSLGAEHFKKFKKYTNSYWIRHFQSKKNAIGVNWLNFEEEIKKVVESLVYEMNNSEEELFWPQKNSDEDLLAFCKTRQYDKKPITYRELFLKLAEEQKKLVDALSLYMFFFVGKKDVKKLPLFKDKEFDKVLSFNYTSIYEDNYVNAIDTCYIHGKPKENCDGNNMVLGFDDHYIDGNKVIAEMIPFEKYYQRIIQKTDNNYFEWLDQLSNENDNLIYIYGHSLAPADGDILRQFILHDNVKVKIFYYDEFDRGEKVRNLAIILGPNELIKKTGGMNPVIEFVKN